MSEDNEEHIAFDSEKFKDVVHFIVSYVADEHGVDAVGNVKLHKCLYYADMLHYLNNFQPLTGAEYQRQKFGPTARHLTKTLRELEADGRLRTETVNYYGFPKRRYIPLSQPETNRLSQDERKLVSHVVDFVCQRTAAEISEFSHDEVWGSVPMGQRIPYYAALAMFPAEVTPDDIDDAQVEAEQLEPLIRERMSANSAV